MNNLQANIKAIINQLNASDIILIITCITIAIFILIKFFRTNEDYKQDNNNLSKTKTIILSAIWCVIAIVRLVMIPIIMLLPDK